MSVIMCVVIPIVHTTHTHSPQPTRQSPVGMFEPPDRASNANEIHIAPLKVSSLITLSPDPVTYSDGLLAHLFHPT